MAKKKTHEEYIKELNEKKLGVKVLENYINASTKILHRCYCGNEWNVKPDEVLRGSGCGCKKFLPNVRKKTTKQYKKELIEKGIKEVIPLEEYKGMHTSIKHRCYCGNENWYVTPANVFQKNSCCRWFYIRRKSHEEYLKKLKERKIKIKPLENYRGVNKRILHKCFCGEIFNGMPKLIYKGASCGCTRSNTHEEYLQELKKRNIQVMPLETYINARTKLLHKCICGNEWKVQTKQVLRGHLCGCVFSKGEKKVKKYLTEKNYNFKHHVSFKDLKGSGKKLLEYDFAIYEKENVIALIEYHGEQHFNYVRHFHRSKKGFLRHQERDMLKQAYAIQKGIPLIELIYSDLNFIDTLGRKLEKLGIGKGQIAFNL